MLLSDSAQWAAAASLLAALAAIATAGVATKALLIAKGQLEALIEQARNAESASQDQLAAIRNQIAVTAQTAEAARLAAARPVVYARSARMIRSTSGKNPLIIELENVGAGPVMRIELECWVFPDRDTDIPTFLTAVEEHIALVQSTAPTGRTLITDPGRPGARREQMVINLVEPFLLEVEAARSCHVYVRLKYFDVYGASYFYPEQGTEDVYPSGLIARESERWPRDGWY